MKKSILIFLVLMLLSAVSSQISIASEPFYEYADKAEILNSLGLFKGSDVGFELDKPVARIEAIVMLVRLLGKEGRAIYEMNEHPFLDVPGWADPYVGYAYKHKYSNGISETEFGSYNSISASQYATFLLRALGYSDSTGDFTWNLAVEKAKSIGIVNADEYERFESQTPSDFIRNDMVLLSFNTLNIKMKASSITLLNRLVDVEKIVSKDAAIKSGKYDTSIKTAIVPDYYMRSTCDYLVDTTFQYFSTIQSEEGLYKIDNATGLKTLLSDSFSRILAVYGDYIYFTKYSRQENGIVFEGIYKIDKSGKNEAIVLKEQANIIHIDSKNIYYTYNNQLLSLPHDKGTSSILLNDFRSDINYVCDGVLYYYHARQNSIFAYDLELNEKKQVPGLFSIDDMVINNGFIYYINLNDNGKIYKVKANGEDRVILVDKYARFLAYNSGYIFYLNCSDNFNLYKVSEDGSDNFKVNTYEISENISKLITDYLNAEKVTDKIASSYDYIWKYNVLFYKGYHYYSNKNDNFCLYRMKNDFSEILKLTDTPVYKFDIFEGRIYCAKGALSKNIDFNGRYYDDVGCRPGFYSISFAGNDVLPVNDESVYNMNVIGNKLFFRSHEFGSTGIRYLENINGLLQVKFIIADEKVGWYSYYNNCLIYTTETDNNTGKIYRYNAENNVKLQLFESIDNFAIIFYLLDDCICVREIKIDSDGKAIYKYYKISIDNGDTQELSQMEYIINDPINKAFIYTGS